MPCSTTSFSIVVVRAPAVTAFTNSWRVCGTWMAAMGWTAATSRTSPTAWGVRFMGDQYDARGGRRPVPRRDSPEAWCPGFWLALAVHVQYWKIITEGLIVRFRPEAPLTILVMLLLSLSATSVAAGIRDRDHGLSVARQWDEELLDAIRIDIPKPPVHARNLFHLSVAMWDAWAAYSPTAVGYLVKEKHAAADVEAARGEAISYAAYRLLKYRFPVDYVDIDGKPCHPNAAASQTAFGAQMDALGYDRDFTSTDGESPSPLGNLIAATVIAYGHTDGSNEGEGVC